MSKLFIGRLPSEAQERDLEDLFKPFGEIKEIRIKQSHGIGFVVW
jgi:RNA recognition motif-containing protein